MLLVTSIIFTITIISQRGVFRGEFIAYSKSLGFADQPDYEYLRLISTATILPCSVRTASEEFGLRIDLNEEQSDL